MEPESPEGGALSHTTHCSLQNQQKKHGHSLPRQQCTNHHALKLLPFFKALLFKPLNFLLKPKKAGLPFFSSDLSIVLP